MSFLWRPGRGCDPDALARLRDAFPRPRRPMGEAWFLGDRSMYEWLYEDIETLPVPRAHTALEAIASGTSCFGPLAEWDEWFHYLLPRLLPRCHEPWFQGGSCLLDALITAFVTQHPAGIKSEPCPGFRGAALTTLGQAMMDEICWPDGEIDVATGLSRGWFAGIRSWQWWMVSGKLSASLFFCLKYLEPDEVGPWLRSVLAIRSPLFVGQMIAWLVGAHPLLTGARSQPADLPEHYPDLGWFWSHVLKGNYSGDHSGNVPLDTFIPDANRMVAMATIAAHVSEVDASDWLATISADPGLEAELDELPFELHRLYRRA